MQRTAINASEARETAVPGEFGLLNIPINCYVCKEQFVMVHHFYHRLCPDCAEFNFSRREASVDLNGRIALVTGGRVKIGYQTSLHLLRAGATVAVTTRFPQDAVIRYSEEPDFSQWENRLRIYGIDFRNLSAVLRLLKQIDRDYPHLDFLVNNAAQTNRHSWEHFQDQLRGSHIKTSNLLSPDFAAAMFVDGHDHTGLLPPSDTILEEKSPETQNSWTSKLEDIAPLELLEAQVVNACVPFLFVKELKPMLVRSPFDCRFVVNVSAKEGRFADNSKTDFHPHTNMAKAAMNMITRTSANDLAGDDIFMNSVDPGWISNEGPEMKQRRMEGQGFKPPLDLVDSAARICDPIFQGIMGEPIFGQLFKDYRSVSW